MKKISIITPAFNSAKFIEDAIQSVLDQKYSNFEHIIIDGGSTDGTLEILKKYPHLVWVSEKDEGQSDAINKGFAKATGDFFGWLNSDDVYEKGVFDKVLNELSNEQYDAVYANYYFADENLNITKEQKSHKPIKWLSLFHCYIPSTTFFFKRKIWDSGIHIDKDFHIVMDKDFFAHILYKDYKVKYLNEYFAKFRWHDDNKSLDSNEVKKIRYEEGLIIFKRYIPYFVLKKMISFSTYKYILNFLRVYRRLLKSK
ncbi:MAG: glycosyltransferase [Calditrichaeota bacterium]|nr:MAG: glycosyltransferase [Calditrichota bacterium]MBL1204599.1 glycosyltransferase [Calditrichota bacterium]NOG44428.1 glycosyltransferase [Calditrichota bacterium]